MSGAGENADDRAGREKKPGDLAFLNEDVIRKTPDNLFQEAVDLYSEGFGSQAAYKLSLLWLNCFMKGLGDPQTAPDSFFEGLVTTRERFNELSSLCYLEAAKESFMRAIECTTAGIIDRQSHLDAMKSNFKKAGFAVKPRTGAYFSGAFFEDLPDEALQELGITREEMDFLEIDAYFAHVRGRLDSYPEGDAWHAIIMRDGFLNYGIRDYDSAVRNSGLPEETFASLLWAVKYRDVKLGEPLRDHPFAQWVRDAKPDAKTLADREADRHRHRRVPII